LGTGEVGTESGPVDCPDCGGSGILPHPHVAVEWRVRDIERHHISGNHASSNDAVASDLRWLIAELRRARTALTEIAALADDAGDAERHDRSRSAPALRERRNDAFFHRRQVRQRGLQHLYPQLQLRLRHRGARRRISAE
jgi:hypothetical protein